MPIVLPAALAIFGSIAMLFLLAGQLQSAYVWPLGLLESVAVTFLVLRAYPRVDERKAERHLCNLLVLAGVALWGVFNAYYAGQHLITDRDPGTYANAGLWLIRHPSLRIPVTDVFGAVPNVSSTSPGFTFDGKSIHLLAQGQHLLPVLLGLAGRIVGVTHMFQVNVLFGVIALLAVYGFARLLVWPFWAMVVTGALAASMPFIYFSRDTYTEPLAAAFTFGGLALLWLALRSGKLSIWFLAGIVLGAGTLTRIDGFLTVVCVIGFLAVMLATASPRERNKFLIQSMMIVAGMAVTAVIGWLDVSRLSLSYYQNTKAQFYPVLLALAAVVVTSSALEWLFSRDNTILPRIDKMTKSWRGRAAATGVLLVTLLLASRPLWYRDYDHPAGSAPVRNFAELSTDWITWYIGPILAVLGALGLALAVAEIVKRRNLLLTATVFVVGATALVYLIKPGIAPDQIWASRRLMPVILPGIAIFGMLAVERLAAECLPRLAWKQLYTGMAAMALLLPPLVTSRHLLNDHDTALLQPVANICPALPDHAAVLWVGTARSHLVQPTMGLCGVPAEGYGDYFTGTEPPSRQTLAMAAQNSKKNGRTAIIGLYGTDAVLLSADDQSKLTDIGDFTFERLDSPVGTPPQGNITLSNTILMGRLLPDGRIKPLAQK